MMFPIDLFEGVDIDEEFDFVVAEAIMAKKKLRIHKVTNLKQQQTFNHNRWHRQITC